MDEKLSKLLVQNCGTHKQIGDFAGALPRGLRQVDEIPPNLNPSATRPEPNVLFTPAVIVCSICSGHFRFTSDREFTPGQFFRSEAFCPMRSHTLALTKRAPSLAPIRSNTAAALVRLRRTACHATCATCVESNLDSRATHQESIHPPRCRVQQAQPNRPPVLLSHT